MSEIKDLIGKDRYHIALIRYKEYKNIREGDVISTGRISIKGKLGNVTFIQNIILECLPIALHFEQSAATLKLLLYFFREILGKTRNETGRPRTGLKYRPVFFMKIACIESRSSFYKSIKVLEKKRIIYYTKNSFDEKFIHLNLFPLTWNIDNERDKNWIKEIVENEIERISKKTGETP